MNVPCTDAVDLRIALAERDPETLLGPLLWLLTRLARPDEDPYPWVVLWTKDGRYDGYTDHKTQAAANAAKAFWLRFNNRWWPSVAGTAGDRSTAEGPFPKCPKPPPTTHPSAPAPWETVLGAAKTLLADVHTLQQQAEARLAEIESDAARPVLEYAKLLQEQIERVHALEALVGGLQGGAEQEVRDGIGAVAAELESLQTAFVARARGARAAQASLPGDLGVTPEKLAALRGVAAPAADEFAPSPEVTKPAGNGWFWVLPEQVSWPMRAEDAENPSSQRSDYHALAAGLELRVRRSVGDVPSLDVDFRAIRDGKATVPEGVVYLVVHSRTRFQRGSVAYVSRTSAKAWWDDRAPYLSATELDSGGFPSFEMTPTRAQRLHFGDGKPDTDTAPLLAIKRVSVADVAGFDDERWVAELRALMAK
jgi:hypothetical protein